MTNAAKVAGACLNCSATLTGPFCSHCGQRAIPAYPTVHELASDAFHEVSGWDGRFMHTVRTMFRRPGQLTVDYLEGRRRSHIAPIRLYLVASLIYFLSAAASPDRSTGGVVEAGGVKIGVFTPDPSTRPGRVAEDVRAARKGDITDEERRAALASIDSAPPFIRPIIRKAIEDPNGFQRSILGAMPRVMFVLLPLFAGVIALFYRGRHYPEHLYFVIHLHAFVFLALTMPELAKIAGLPVVEQVLGVTAVVWIAVYAVQSFRRVYGGSLGMTLAKGAGIGVLYTLLSVPAILLLLTWAALRG